MHSLARTGSLIALSLCLFFSAWGTASAVIGRSCTGNAQCGTGEVCTASTNLEGQSVRTCQRPAATGTTPGSANTGLDQGSANSPDGSIRLVNPLKVDSIEGLLDLIIEAAIRIGTIILVLALIWVGFLFVAARGNPEKLSTARTAFIWTIIGGLILLGAKGLSEVIQSTATNLGS